MDKKKKLAAGIAAVCVVTALLGLKNFFTPKEQIQSLERNSPGAGETAVNLEVRTDEGNFPIDFQLEERIYEASELDGVFEEGKKWLDTVWLGDNTSSDSVTQNLYFPERIPHLGLTVQWKTESYRLIQSDGKVTEEALSRAPLNTKIRAVLKYGEFEKSYDYELRIVENVVQGDEALKQGILKEVKSRQTEERTQNEMILPDTFNGTKLEWYVREDPVWPKIFIFGNLILVLIYFASEEKRMQQIRDKSKELERDYPDIVYKLVLLVSSGMTVKGAWEKLIYDYRKEKNNTGKVRCGYEEMEMALREMNYGISELKAYENFGKRCASQNYIRFSSLLIQQVKRGARGMNQLLMQEVMASEILRKENARKRAEEAGTKLLFPMVLLMAVVFAVLMIPAFLSISI